MSNISGDSKNTPTVVKSSDLSFDGDLDLGSNNLTTNGLTVNDTVSSSYLKFNSGVKALFEANNTSDVIQFKNGNATGYTTAQFTDSDGDHWWIGTGNPSSGTQYRNRNYILTAKEFDIFSAGFKCESNFTVNKETDPIFYINENGTNQIKISHNTTAEANYIQSLNSHPLIIDYNSVEKLRINNDGITVSGSINSNSINSASQITMQTTTNNPVAFNINNTEKARINSLGLGINKTPAYPIDCRGAVNIDGADTGIPRIRFQNTNEKLTIRHQNSVAYITCPLEDPLILQTNTTDRLRIGGDGNVLISNNLTVNGDSSLADTTLNSLVINKDSGQFMRMQQNNAATDRGMFSDMITLKDDIVTSRFITGIGGTGFDGDTDIGTCTIGSWLNNDFKIIRNQVEKIRVNASTIDINSDTTIGGKLTTTDDITIEKAGTNTLTLNDTRTTGAAGNIILMRGLTLDDSSVDIHLKNGPDFTIMSGQNGTDRNLAVFKWDTGDLNILRNLNCVDVNASGDISAVNSTFTKTTTGGLKIGEATGRIELATNADAYIQISTGQIDYTKTQNMANSSSLIFPTLDTAPALPVNGMSYYNTTDHKLKIYANGTWVNLN